jgi:hypothetical protein
MEKDKLEIDQLESQQNETPHDIEKSNVDVQKPGIVNEVPKLKLALECS